MRVGVRRQYLGEGGAATAPNRPSSSDLYLFDKETKANQHDPDRNSRVFVRQNHL